MDAMTKRQLIDEILSINHSAQPAFLADFREEELREYLQKLLSCAEPRRTGAAASSANQGEYVPVDAPLFESVA